MNFPVLNPLDPLLNAHRPDLADVKLKGRTDAERFVAGRPAQVTIAAANIHRQPNAGSTIISQFLLGEEVFVFENKIGWSWVQSARDGYTGYVASSALGELATGFTHQISVPRTLVYPQPDLKLPPVRTLSIGGLVRVEGQTTTRGTGYSLLGDGTAITTAHLGPVGGYAGDFVDAALKLLHTPYQWGGTSGFGVDCSGIVSVALRLCGQTVLRDTRMQAATLGSPLPATDNYGDLLRGDLVFWQGHVAIAVGDGNLLHASGGTMDVTLEPAQTAIDRIATQYGRPIGARRPDGF